MKYSRRKLQQRFPNLNKNLEILAEECAEVIQAKSKLFRFGINHCRHDTGENAIEHLENEIGDMMAMIRILWANGTIDMHNINAAEKRKIDKLYDWYDNPDEIF